MLLYITMWLKNATLFLSCYLNTLNTLIKRNEYNHTVLVYYNTLSKWGERNEEYTLAAIRAENLPEWSCELNLKNITLRSKHLPTNYYQFAVNFAGQFGQRSVHRSIVQILFLFCSSHPERQCRRSRKDFHSKRTEAFLRKWPSRRRNALPRSARRWPADTST